MISDPSRRISACSRPTALLAASSERNELEQTSSARPSVRCASVILVGRISCRVTATPALAICQAASEPARPAPITCTVSIEDLAAVMAHGLARFTRPCTCANSREPILTCFMPWIRQRPRRGGRYPFVRQPNKRSAVIVPGCNARNVRAIKADIGQFAIAKLGQFADTALIVPERLDHADERE